MRAYRKVCSVWSQIRTTGLTVEIGIPVFGLAGTIQEEVAKELGIPFVAELYGDVKYSKDGTLVIDRKKKAWTQEQTKKHISSQVENSSVEAVTGEVIELPVGVSPANCATEFGS